MATYVIKARRVDGSFQVVDTRDDASWDTSQQVIDLGDFMSDSADLMVKLGVFSEAKTYKDGKLIAAVDSVFFHN